VHSKHLLYVSRPNERWYELYCSCCSGGGGGGCRCRDGAQRSGLVCALSYVIERLKVEQDVDVFQSVKHIRINRPQLIPTFVRQRRYLLVLPKYYSRVCVGYIKWAIVLVRQNHWTDFNKTWYVELHTGGHPACKLWLRYGDVGGLGE